MEGTATPYMKHARGEVVAVVAAAITTIEQSAKVSGMDPPNVTAAGTTS